MLESADPPTRPVRALLIAAVLAALALLVYRPALENGFVDYDDNLYVTNNRAVQQGLTAPSLRWAMRAQVASNWHPLTLLSHMADCHLYGLEPRGHHLTSVAIHALNTALLFGVLVAMTGAVWRSALVAALFAVHPTHVESVAWVSERKDVLSAFFWLAGMAFYARYALRPSIGRYAAVAIAMACGLMAKPMVVTFPCVLLLLDVWPLGRLPLSLSPAFWSRLRFLVAEKIPLLLLAGAAGVMTLVTQGSALVQVSQRTFPQRMANAVVSYAAYVSDTLFPTGLAALYPFDPQLPLWRVAGALAFIIAMTTFAFALRRNAPYLGVGWLWYLGTLIPVIGLIPVGGQARADRFTYLPTIGLYVMAVWGIAKLVEGRPRARMAALVAGAAAVAGLAAAAQPQIATWRGSERLFRHAIAVTEKNDLAHYNLGETLRSEGQLEEAIEHFHTAMALAPDWAPPEIALASALAGQGRADEALPHFERALALEPSDPRIHHAMAMALDDLGRVEEAREHLERALTLDPGFAPAHFGLGASADRAGDTTRAIEHYRSALAADAALPLHGRLGTLLGQAGALDESIFWLRQATLRQPNDISAWFNLGTTLARQGKLVAAESVLRQALALMPGQPQLTRALADVRERLGRVGEAPAAMPP